MNPRERYLETILFGKPDRIPLHPGGPRESTLRAWGEQGFPEGRGVMEVLFETLGIEPESFHISPHHGISFRMIPEFEEKYLEHKDGHYIVRDWMGAIVEISDRFDASYLRSAKDFCTRRWIKFPIQTRADWEEMKWRYDPKDPRRFPDDFEERCRELKNRETILGVHVNAPFWQLREWVGLEGLCTMMLDDPDFVHELVDFWIEFVSATMAGLLSRVDIDVFSMSEDMAFKGHSFISPEMTREFLCPAYRRWIEEAKAAGAKIFDMDSDGYVGELIPVWIEAGINCCVPVEVAAGCDVVEFRRQFGRRMGYRGGIDKRLIARGGKAIEEELDRIIPFMLEEGGYIPGCDHGVPPDISWPNFIEYTRRLAQLTGWL